MRAGMGERDVCCHPVISFCLSISISPLVSLFSRLFFVGDAFVLQKREEESGGKLCALSHVFVVACCVVFSCLRLGRRAGYYC